MGYGAPLPEVEVKLLVATARDLRAMGRLRALGSYRLQPQGRQHLHSVYLDTANRTLARHGVALRLRRAGRRWEMTAKWAGRIDGAVHERPELTVTLDGPMPAPFLLPDGPLRQHLTAFVMGRPLMPILVTNIQRDRLDVMSAGGRRIAELALDTVQGRAPDGAAAGAKYFEVEIEALHGTRRQVATLGRLLRERFDLVPSTTSKFARGLLDVYGPGGVREYTPPRGA